MQRFLINLALFAVVVLGSIQFFGTVKANNTQEKSDYMGAIIDKHKRLESLPGRRILLAGGSSVAFGTDSKAIEERFHLPVVNLAMHAGLGLEFILNEVKQASRKGDIVLLTTEYYLANEDDALKLSTAELYPSALGYFSHSLLLPIKIYYTNRLAEMRENALKVPGLASFFNVAMVAPQPPVKGLPVYARRSFNERGDAVGHLDKPAPKHKFSVYTMPAYHYYEGIEPLNEFYKDCQQKGVQVYYFFPVLAQSKYLENKESLTHYYSDFSKAVAIPMLNTPTSVVLPDSLFFDTVYHLTKDGREIRTNQIISALEKRDVK
jgi:hypothetical protein